MENEIACRRLDPMICTPRKSESLMIWTTFAPKLMPFGTSSCNANHLNAQGSVAGAELPLTCDRATEQETTAVPPSARNPLVGCTASVGYRFKAAALVSAAPDMCSS
jgi:hypothetical protein